MSISYDQMNSLGRAYYQGSFRGEDFAYGEMEGKHDRTNIAIDFGIGNMSKGLYVQTQEVF